MKKLLILFIGFLVTLSVTAQTRTISGKVVDAANEPVIGASVVESAGNGTITDINGTFSIRVNAGSQLTISYIGYATQQIAIGNSNSVTVVLVKIPKRSMKW